MRRSICIADPYIVLAGQKKNFTFSYTTSTDLTKGTTLIFEIESDGRDIDFEVPQVENKSNENYIWAILPDNKVINAKASKIKQVSLSTFEFLLPQEIKTGETIAIHIGSVKKDPLNGILVQKYTQRKKTFNLHIESKNKKESEAFHVDIKGNKLNKLKIVTPSIVSRNKRFDVVIRFEDKFGNLTSNAEEGTLIELSYKHLRDNLSWKLFIPETGFITLPNLYFNEEGIYKIQLKNLKNNEVFFSDPIKCIDNYEKSLFWGLLHGENIKYDSIENIESTLRYFRDEISHQFYSTSNFDSEEETSNDDWKKIMTNVAEFNEDERFTAMLGMQYSGQEKEEGIREFLFSKDNKPIIRKKDLKSNSLKKIYKMNSSKDMLSIPCFTMGNGFTYNFNDFNEEFEKVVEIYNVWGSSEMTKQEGNLFPITGPVKENAEGSIQKALLAGHRFGFVAGGLDDRGVYASFFDTAQVQYNPGLTAILAKNQSRDDIFYALQNRSCYATTGEKILIGFNIANEDMGSFINMAKKPGLRFNRYISGYVISPSPIEYIEIIRNNKVWTKIEPKDPCEHQFVIDDTQKIEEILIQPENEKPSFVFYYLRTKLKNGHMGWSSPIWVDMSVDNNKKIKKEIKKL
ncbi:MAG: DUF3604 domain-containing protein [Chlamydiae bacterium RIFCSPHIGHO2_12_FULL_27_8]|nr:MAG: DUF3604 domain-containing protein [Chlamydiae bacterium RIFCSPHIGHO2_12_FULL_27_8]